VNQEVESMGLDNTRQEKGFMIFEHEEPVDRRTRMTAEEERELQKFE